jgi:predicted  nucleic acid-binding Zn-ribbon protein
VLRATRHTGVVESDGRSGGDGRSSLSIDDAHAARATVDALRAELERREQGHAEATQTALRSAHGEIVQLQATIAALRTELERQRADHLEAIATTERSFREERDQLHQTIAALRAQLERGVTGPGPARRGA